jgi:hypothetical protein
MERKPDGEVEDYANNRRSDAGEGSGQCLISAQPLYERGAEEDPKETG